MTEGSEFLFYPKAYLSGGALTGLKNAEVAIIATRRYVFMMPVVETSFWGLGVTATKHWFEGTDGNKEKVADVIAKRLAVPGLTLEALEADLLGFLPPEYIVKMDQLASLKVWTRFLPQVRFKRNGKRVAEVLALRGKANHERFKAFYAQA
jgi:hypothetical protein